MIINISEAKANLSKLVNMACHGEEVIIATNNLPLIEIVPHKSKGKRALGILGYPFKAGQIAIDFLF